MTEVPLGHAPSLSAVDRELAEALDDAALPLPTEHHLHSVHNADLTDEFGFRNVISLALKLSQYLRKSIV